MGGLGTGFKFYQRGHRLPVATRARQQSHRDRIHAPCAFGSRAEHQQAVDRAAFKGAVQAVTGLEGKTGGIVTMAAARTHPAFGANHHSHWLVQHLDFQHGFFLGLDQRAARVGKLFGICLDFLDHEAPQGRRTTEDFFQLALLFAQAFKLLFDPDGLEPG